MSSEYSVHSKGSLNERYVSQNARILKLIKSKMEPLQKSRSSKLFLPKIYRQLNKIISNDKEAKKYIEIQIKQEDENLITPNTEIQQEHKYNLQTQRINYRLNSKKQTNNILDSLLKLNHRRISKRKQSLRSSQRFNCTLIQEDSYQLDEITQRQQQYAKEQQNNMQKLNKIKQEIDDSKRKFLQNIKLSDYIGQRNDKENYSFEYIVNKIQTFKQKEERPTKHTTLSAYQDISPNKISDYIEIFNPTTKKRILADEQQQKDIVPIPMFDSRYRRTEFRKKTTMVPHKNHSEMAHVASKLRLKANHRRLIQLNK